MMRPVPVYLKTRQDEPRPKDDEFYWVTGSGLFLGRNHAFFQSDVPTKHRPRGLAPHHSRCVLRYPKLSVCAFEYILGFFDRIYRLHRSEAIVLLYWDLKCRRYRIVVPQQEATVWQSYDGKRHPMDVRYSVPLDTPANYLLVGDFHSHGDLGATSSATDRFDEEHRDGIHGIVGRIDREEIELSLEFAIDGCRFSMKPEQFLKGYGKRRAAIPEAWIRRVRTLVYRNSLSGAQDKSYYTFGQAKG